MAQCTIESIAYLIQASISLFYYHYLHQFPSNPSQTLPKRLQAQYWFLHSLPKIVCVVPNIPNHSSYSPCPPLLHQKPLWFSNPRPHIPVSLPPLPASYLVLGPSLFVKP